MKIYNARYLDNNQRFIAAIITGFIAAVILGNLYGLIKLMERVMRIELTYTAWKAVVLPLNYTRMS